ncbi:membrane associated rhomboid family serine protease [Ulvibacter sp. MAR_2010_11]|uniref:rhomboid family protein n=1 Tax=Ulvibacter sp. MAR_2010_11 TaxID=1250229 RepID=UPI000C2C1239|nr:rhomboid family intramembrane serine protease [Ulvibacter sp. MAR_2010_11]PKA83799.1 membrane associated rhomboid family serine protease [Ulvibacter sp. MAR_2010_11]
MEGKSLTYQFKTAGIVIKLIVINLAVFLLVNLTAFLLEIPREQLAQWFVLPDTFGELIVQPWSFITYSFLHFGFWHLFWNMLWLYWFGGFVLNLFNSKRFLTIYLLGAISGGLYYVLAYNFFPVFSTTTGYLIGASAAVRAIVIFIAAYNPNTEVRLIFFTVKIWHIGAFVVLLDLIQLPTSGNAGGLIAHLGGAVFGYVYAIQLAKGNDIGKWFENVMEWFENLFTPRTKKPFKKVHRTTPAASGRSNAKPEKTNNQKKVDTILDKIGKSGYDSLTKAEKDFLFKAGKED